MSNIKALPASLVGLVLGLAAIGAATYLASSGAIPGGDAIAVIGVVLGGGAGVVGAHVGGNVALVAASGLSAQGAPATTTATGAETVGAPAPVATGAPTAGQPGASNV